MHGVINVLKHPGVSSHDIVNMLRKLLHTKKVGHTGTLDPDAVGVLPVCVGKATRLVEYLTTNQKTYRALLCFGSQTNTQDGSGQVIKKTKLPNLTKNEFENLLLTNFAGKIEQIPPMFSAIKKNGKPLYLLARKGEEVEREPREVEIHDLKLINYDQCQALIEVTCSKGTYIRTLCEDIGKATGSSAYMSFLLRVQSGNFHVKDAFTIEEISEMAPEQFLIPPALSIKDFPKLNLPAQLLNRIKNGNKVPLILIEENLDRDCKYKVLDTRGELLAIGKVEEEYFKPVKVFR